MQFKDENLFALMLSNEKLTHLKDILTQAPIVERF
jgi:hypothetical protein